MAIPTSILGARMGSCIIGQTPWDEFFENFGAGLSIEYGVLLTVLLGVIYFPIVLKKPQYQIRDTLNEKVVIRQVSL
jgi:prolipoprotein diacylglyceryltransferase